jgi:hypothetical protein
MTANDLLNRFNGMYTMTANDLVNRFNGRYTAEELLTMVLGNMDITERSYVISRIEGTTDELDIDED